MKQKITPEQQKAIADFLKGRHIPSGLGTKDEPCSLAAINLALTGKMTDNIPDCMSEVIGRWIIIIQDSMPDEMRNSDKWRELLPLAAGTGREYEKERLAIIIDWMWEAVLPPLQPLADKHGFGDKWREMCEDRTAKAAGAAARAAAWAAKSAGDSTWSARAAWAADSAAWAARAAGAADSAAWAARAAGAAYAAGAACAAAEAAGDSTWETINPPVLLEKLVKVDTQ